METTTWQGLERQRQQLWQEYYEYLLSCWMDACRQAGINPPIYLLAITNYGDGLTIYTIGNDPPGPSIQLTCRPGDLLASPG